MPLKHKLNNKIKKKLHFIAFYFYKFIKTELNYLIYNKKFKYYFIKNMH